MKRTVLILVLALTSCSGKGGDQTPDDQPVPSSCRAECPAGSFAVVGQVAAEECLDAGDDGYVVSTSGATVRLCAESSECGTVSCRFAAPCACGVAEAGSAVCAPCDPIDIDPDPPVDPEAYDCRPGDRVCGDGEVEVCSWVGEIDVVACPPQWECRELPDTGFDDNLVTCLPPDAPPMMVDPADRVVPGGAPWEPTAPQGPPRFAGPITTLGIGFDVETKGFAVMNPEIVFGPSSDELIVCGRDGCNQTIGWSTPLSEAAYCAAQDACVGDMVDCEGMDIFYFYDYATFAGMGAPVLQCVYDVMSSASCPAVNPYGDCPAADQLTEVGPAVGAGDIVYRSVGSSNSRYVGFHLSVGGVASLGVTEVASDTTDEWALPMPQPFDFLAVGDDGTLVALAGDVPPITVHRVRPGSPLETATLDAFEEGTWSVGAVEVSPNGGVLALSWSGPRSVVSTWSFAAADHTALIELASAPMRFSAQEGVLATFDVIDRAVDVWDLGTPTWLGRAEPASPDASRLGVVFDPSGTQLATWSSFDVDTLQTWDVGAELALLETLRTEAGMAGSRPTIRYASGGDALLAENPQRKMWWIAR